ncbi:MAG: phospho-sugar mutase, partial [Parachlamydiaceae bacterium]
NGYKVYWNDGGQVLPPHDIGIIEEVYKLKSLSDIKIGDANSPFINWVLDEIDEKYLSAIEKLRLYSGEVSVKVLYTPLHGTGITLMPKVMKNWGVIHFKTVEKQSYPDGNFTNAPVPNPEEKEALNLGIEELLLGEHDLLIANDPDADRVGVAVRHHGKAVILTGNQIASLCLNYLIKNKTDLPANAAFIKTIVTTELFRKIAVLNGYACFDVLTGFKYVAEKIREWEDEDSPFTFIFGGEESYGYLYGKETRDKDALIMSALIAEMAGFAKRQNKTLIDLRDELFKEYGLYYEGLSSLKFPESKEGKEAMKKAVERLRSNPPLKFGDVEVIAIDDYLIREKIDLISGRKEPLTLEQSDVLVFWLKDHSKVMIRPSGTEPKVKIYCGVTTPSYDTVESGLLALEKKTQGLINILKELTL